MKPPLHFERECSLTASYLQRKSAIDVRTTCCYATQQGKILLVQRCLSPQGSGRSTEHVSKAVFLHVGFGGGAAIDFAIDHSFGVENDREVLLVITKEVSPVDCLDRPVMTLLWYDR